MSNIIDLKHNKKPASVSIDRSEARSRVTTRSRLVLFFKNKWYLPAGIIVAVAVLIFSFVFNIFDRGGESARAEWFNDFWHYRQQFDVFNASATQDLVGFQVAMPTSTLGLLTAWQNGKLKNDFSDLRFTDANGNLIDYWHENATSTMYDVYLKMPNLPKNATTTVYAYYGNPSAVSVKKDGSEIFEFFDDFNGNALNSANWPVVQATPAISGGELVLTDGGGREALRTNQTFSQSNHILGFKTKQSNTALASLRLGFSNTADLSANFYTDDAVYYFRGSTNSFANRNEGGVSIFDLTAAEDVAYHKYEIAWSSLDTKLYIDNTLDTTNDAQVPDEPLYIRLENDDTTYSTVFDWVYVRKFASSGPNVSVTAGTSEEVGGGPVGYWKFDEGYGATAFDSSGSGNNGTLTNMSTTGTSTAWITGKANKAPTKSATRSSAVFS